MIATSYCQEVFGCLCPPAFMVKVLLSNLWFVHKNNDLDSQDENEDPAVCLQEAEGLLL